MTSTIDASVLSELEEIFPKTRIHSEEILRTAFSVDASIFERIAAVVVDAESEDEIVALFSLATNHNIPLTFRGSGTSLNGQCSGDGILVRLRGPAWKRWHIEDSGRFFKGYCGLLGEEIAELLQSYGRNIGPDPASFAAASFGGMVVNNAAGMCCTVRQNAYATLRQIRCIFPDGTLLDTGDAESVAAFRDSHRALLDDLLKLRQEIIDVPETVSRIKKKYLIKNTCGYAVNAFIDFDDPVEILSHLLIGSEGTLGFVSNATLETIEALAVKATALVFLPDLATTIQAVQRWQDAGCAHAVELFDSTTLAAMAKLPTTLEEAKNLTPGACAILIETRGQHAAEVQQNIEKLVAITEDLNFLSPVAFFTDEQRRESLWAFRRALFSALAGNKKPEEMVVFEDICFPPETMEKGIDAVGELFKRYGYTGGINGHAFHGNFHFALPVNFTDKAAYTTFHQFIDELMELVVRLDGSLKSEHGTGYTVAPYVELEWGREVYAVMKRVKALFDSSGILNPGVLINADPTCHTQNLKIPVPCDPLLDKCVDCGFCEPVCPSRELSFTPRQRVHLLRKIEAKKQRQPREARVWEKIYDALGTDLCATDGLCTSRCPMQVDVAEFVRRRRGGAASARTRAIAHYAGNNIHGFTRNASRLLSGVAGMQQLTGDRFMSACSAGMRKVIPVIPAWNAAMPRGAQPLGDTCRVSKEGEQQRVVYFPSCAIRSMGDSVHHPVEPLAQVTMRVLEKAGLSVVYPSSVDGLCCGKVFETKGLQEEALRKSKELEAALLEVSNDGNYPILCETSPCLARMKKTLDSRLQLYEPVEFAAAFLLPRLQLTKKKKRVAIHPTCSTRALGFAELLAQLASRCAEQVVWPKEINCCGFSGDKGFHRPELNASALSTLRERVDGCEAGFSTSRTCEIGLSLHSGISYKNIMYLLDECS